MKYRNGYKIVLEEDEHYQTDIYPEQDIYYYRHGHLYVSLNTEGYLIVYAGYPSDLASGPTFNTKNTRRGAVGHDALYELLRQGLLDQKWRVPSDEELDKWLEEDGMSSARRWIWETGLNWADGKDEKQKNIKPILEAP